MQIYGEKKQKGGQQKPNIQKDTTASTNFFQGLYGLSEGEVYGLVDGGKSIKLDGTPIINANGQPNFSNVWWDFRTGTIDQEYIKGFSSVENETNVGVELRHDRPYVRTLTNTHLSAIVVRLSWSALCEQKDNGDITGYRIDYAIDVQTDGGAWTPMLTTFIHDKASQGYQRSHRIDLPKARRNWTIRVRRITANRDSELIGDTMSVAAVTEVIDATLAYPCTSLLALRYDAETFGNVAKVAVRMRGMIIQVPTNYDPIARTYTGLWDGTFKMAYSNNPAWVFYDLCTARRYGLGERLAGKVDKWRLYQLGQYCDEMVDDGMGGKEPRFAVNVYLQKAEDAYSVLQNLASVFRAMSYWDGTQIIVDSDTPKDSVYTFGTSNVIDGAFSYTGTRARDRHSIAKVAYDDPDNDYKTEYVFVRDEYAIAKYGIRQLDINAFGCTSKAQATRVGEWAIRSEQLESETVSFSTGLEGFIPQVGDVIGVADNARAGTFVTGRITAVTGNNLTLDRRAGKVGDTFVLGDKTAKITKVSGNTITTDKQTGGKVGQVWAIGSDTVAPREYRVMSIAQNDDTTFAITALQYERAKFDDSGVRVTPKPVSIIRATVLDAPESVAITSHTRTHQGQAITTLTINWAQVTGATAYIVEWKKDENAWQTQKIASQSIDIDGVYAGSYQAKVRAVDAFGNESDITSSVMTAIVGKQGKPPRLARLVVKGVLFGMNLDWVFNAGSEDTNFTEIQVSPDGRSNITVLGTFAYPTNKHEITGLQGNLTQFYRGRIVDKLGNTSDWTAWVRGTTSADADKVLDILSGQINQSHLDQTLRTPIGKIGTLETAVNAVNSQLPQLNQQIANATRDIGTERSRITSAIRDISALQTADNTKTLELANLKQTVGGHTGSIRDLAVTTGDLSQKYSQLKTASDTVNSEITAIKQTQSGQAIEQNSLKARFDSFAVGGRNYLTKASFGTWRGGTWQDYRFVISDKNLAGPRFTRAEAIEQGADVVFSFKIAKKSGQITSIGGHTHSLSHHQIYIDGVLVGNDFNAGVAYPDDLAVHQIVIKARDNFATAANDKSLYIQPNRGSNGYADAYSCEIWDCKLERGNIATDWAPAPEDVEGAIRTTANALIDEYKESRVEPDRAVAQRIGTLETDLNKGGTGIKARLATSEKAISENEKALSQRISALDSSINSPNGGLSSRVASAERAITQANETIAEKHDQLTARFDSGNLFKASTATLGHYLEEREEGVLKPWGSHRASDFIEVKTNTTYEIRSFNGNFSNLRVMWLDENKNFIKGQIIARGGDYATFNSENASFVRISSGWTRRDDNVWQMQVAGLASELGASLDEFKRAEARANEAISSRVTQLSTTVGGQTASIKNVEDSVNGVRAIKAVTVDNNGFISGYGLMSELQNGRVTSRFGINADQIYFGATTSAKKPFVFTTRTTTIDGVSYPAGAWLNSASIANASIKLAHIDKASIGSLSALSANIGTLTTKDSRGTFTYTGSKIELRDPQGRLLMEMGLL